MHTFVVLLLFVGMALVIHGIYEEKLQNFQRNTRVEYRFIPRTMYEEQMAQADLAGKMGNMFEKESPWYDRYIGEDIRKSRSLLENGSAKGRKTNKP
jgi:hypothetical protein